MVPNIYSNIYYIRCHNKYLILHFRCVQFLQKKIDVKIIFLTYFTGKDGCCPSIPPIYIWQHTYVEALKAINVAKYNMRVLRHISMVSVIIIEQLLLKNILPSSYS